MDLLIENTITSFNYLRERERKKNHQRDNKVLFGKVILGYFDHFYLKWSKLFLVIPNRRNGQIDEMSKMSVWLK